MSGSLIPMIHLSTPLEKIRAIPGRAFKMDTGEWMFPKEQLGHLLALFESQIVWVQPLRETSDRVSL